MILYIHVPKKTGFCLNTSPSSPFAMPICDHHMRLVGWERAGAALGEREGKFIQGITTETIGRTDGGTADERRMDHPCNPPALTAGRPPGRPRVRCQSVVEGFV